MNKWFIAKLIGIAGSSIDRKNKKESNILNPLLLGKCDTHSIISDEVWRLWLIVYLILLTYKFIYIIGFEVLTLDNAICGVLSWGNFGNSSTQYRYYILIKSSLIIQVLHHSKSQDLLKMTVLYFYLFQVSLSLIKNIETQIKINNFP